jgi:hypothetical protein
MTAMTALTTSMRSSWVYVPDPQQEASQSEEDPDHPDAHFYWELEFPTNLDSPTEIVPSIPIGPVTKPAKKPKPHFESPISRSHSSSPVGKVLDSSRRDGNTPLPHLGVRAKTHRIQNSSSTSSMAGKPTSGSKVPCSNDRNPCVQRSRNTDSPIRQNRSRSKTPEDEKYSVIKKDKSSGLFFRRRSPSRRSQSCEQLSVGPHVKKEMKRSRRRCPTPPRVLSPNLESMRCELVADI